MKAVVLLSGGVDSSVALAIALDKGRHCHAITFDYGQRHSVELLSAQAIAFHYHVPQTVVKIDNHSFAFSGLIGKEKIPKNRTPEEMALSGTPNTYVPARNTLFLSYAMGLAEMIEAGEIYYGANLHDHTGYPDCHPRFVLAFQGVLNVASPAAVQGNPPLLVTPLLYWDKDRIVEEGERLGVPLEKTFSCYDPNPDGKHCRECDSCVLRFKALV